MEVILHLGAHRTATASFRHYLHGNRARLEGQGIAYWGPPPGPVHPADASRDSASAAERQRDRDRLQGNLDLAERRGIRHLVISDVDVIGSVRDNLDNVRMYRAAGERLARYAWAFDGRLTRAVLTIRSQDSYWSSAATLSVAEGHAPLGPRKAEVIATRRRSWRDVITDLACALQGAVLQVQPYEVFGSLPECALAAMTGAGGLPLNHAREWLGRSPDLDGLRKAMRGSGADPDSLPDGYGRWHPFDRDQTLALREAYADDLFWLSARAGGLATFIDEPRSAKAGQQPPADPPDRGRKHGKDNRRLA